MVAVVAAPAEVEPATLGPRFCPVDGSPARPLTGGLWRCVAIHRHWGGAYERCPSCRRQRTHTVTCNARDTAGWLVFLRAPVIPR